MRGYYMYQFMTNQSNTFNLKGKKKKEYIFERHDRLDKVITNLIAPSHVHAHVPNAF